MGKNTWIKFFGLVLAASLAIVGCDSDNSGVTADSGSSATGSTGGGGSTGGNGSNGGGGGPTAGAGLTGGGLTGLGSGSGGTTTGGTTTGGTTTGGTTTGGTTTGGTTTGGTTTGGTTTGGGTTAGGFLGALSATPAATLTSLNNPTQIVRINNTIYFVDGYGLGQSNGRLMTSTLSNNGGTVTISTPQQVTSTPTSTISSSLNSPFGLVASGANLYISVGLNLPGAGAIVRVSGITAGATPTATFQTISAPSQDTTLPLNPAFLLTANVDGSEYVYWSEYAQQNSSGGVRRVRADGTGTVDTVVNGLSFPAGIATDNSNLFICDSGGGANGQVVRAPLSPAGKGPSTPTSPSSTIIGVAAGDQAMARPFDIIYDGANGMYFTEGNALQGITGILPTGQSNGTVRYIANVKTTSNVVVDSVTNGAGIAAVPLTSSTVGIAYTESIVSNGRVMRAIVDTVTPAAVTPVLIDTGIDFPLDVAINSPTVPIFSAVINYAGGQSNGLLRGYAPTP